MGSGLWDSQNEMVAIADIVPEFLRVDGFWIEDLNDAGQLAGARYLPREGDPERGRSCPIILTPIPEPTALATLALGFGALARRRRR
jgi:hypothetical protein